jgi:hypothetical protein
MQVKMEETGRASRISFLGRNFTHYAGSDATFKKFRCQRTTGGLVQALQMSAGGL